MASGLKQRIITAIAIGVPILFLLFFNTQTRIILLCLLLVLTAVEFLKLSYSSLKEILGIVSLGVSLAMISFLKFEVAFYPLLVISLLFNVYLVWELYYSKKTTLRTNGWLKSILYTSVPFALLFAGTDSTRIDILFPSILLIIWIADISAYFVGKSIGKNKLMPRISPGKSWEGFWGAGLICLISSYIFSTVTQIYSIQAWALIAVTTWLFGSVGDLVESKFKRALDIKDSGSILPGHGGFLDRFDGFYFCIPFVLGLVFILEKLPLFI